MNRGAPKGLTDRADLAGYKAVWREPLEGDWHDLRVITAPPPSSGGIALLQMLSMKHDAASLFQGVPLNSPQYLHLVAEIEKRVFADRAQYLGDPDMVPVPVAALIDPAYLARRAAQIDPTQPSPLAAVEPGLEKPQTTHFSIVDRFGNAVSNTYTLNGWFGSGVVVEGAGFLLNDEMDDFSVKPGIPNQYGVVGAQANAIAPYKRPLSSMTPTILLQHARVAMVLGTPGGSRIFTSVFQVLADVYDFGLDLKPGAGADEIPSPAAAAEHAFRRTVRRISPGAGPRDARTRLPARSPGLQRGHRGHRSDRPGADRGGRPPSARSRASGALTSPPDQWLLAPSFETEARHGQYRAAGVWAAVRTGLAGHHDISRHHGIDVPPEIDARCGKAAAVDDSRGIAASDRAGGRCSSG